MDLISDISFIIIVFVFVSALLLYLAGEGEFYTKSAYAKELLAQRKEDAWQDLAERYKLTYLPGESVKEAHLFGNYRGYYLDLKIQQEHNPVNTYELTYFSLQSDKKISERETKTPASADIHALLRLSTISFDIKGQTNISSDGQTLSHTQLGIEHDKLYLQKLFDFACELLRVYPFLITSGDAFIPELQTLARYNDLPLHLFARQVLAVINTKLPEDKTHRLICSDCLSYYQEAANSTLDLDFGFDVGCRICNKRRNYEVGKITAVLDHHMEQEIIQHDYEIWVNWLIRRKLFDFDRIEINQASDEEVERFIVQAGNETDATRKARYKSVYCVISPDCKLSQNTVRLLGEMFGGNDSITSA